jgi:dTMP kinase
VSDELRGRTFATLYTVVRLCLLVSLTISPLFADFWDWVTHALLDNQAISIGPYSYALPGVRIALWCGGIITLIAGVVAWRSIRRAELAAEAEGGDAAAMVERIEHGPEAPIMAMGLVEPTVPVENDAAEAAPPATDPPTEELEGMTEDPPDDGQASEQDGAR